MASNFITQLPGFKIGKLPFGWGLGKDASPSHSQSPSTPSSASPSSPPSSGGYRARKSISEAHGVARPGPDLRARLEVQMSLSLINKGLLNPTGENNCFLNSAVQMLWHIDVFRRSFRKVKGHMCVEEACIFCALKELFEEFQHGKQSVIPPDTLRKAMAECYEGQHRFQLGLMDDAAECFEKILEQLHLQLTGSEDMDTCPAQHCISHQKFSLTILERTECVCGATSEPLSFVQFVHYISSAAIVKEAQKYSEKNKPGHTPSERAPSADQAASSGQGSDQASSSAGKGSDKDVAATGGPVTAATRPRLYSASQVHFGKILNQASSFGESRPCPDFERCKKKVAVKRILLNCPDVVCVGMIWDSDQPSVDVIMSVVLSIGLTLQLSDLFDHVFADNAQFNQYELTALIAYYGRHYSTFCYHSKMREWIYFDDAKFRTVGTEWKDVCEQIRKGHFQPLLLVYTNPFAEELDMSQAPQVVTKIETTPHTAAATPLSTITEETPPTNAPSDAPSTSKPEAQKGAESATGKVQQQGQAKSAESAIDPMTLSLIPIRGAKSTTPIVEHNSASATPTSVGATPTPAAQQQPDLMTFSISPAVLGGMAPGGRGGVGGGARQGSKVIPSGGQQTASSSASDDDLIQFSLSPALLGMVAEARLQHQSPANSPGTSSGHTHPSSCTTSFSSAITSAPPLPFPISGSSHFQQKPSLVSSQTPPPSSRDDGARSRSDAVSQPLLLLSSHPTTTTTTTATTKALPSATAATTSATAATSAAKTTTAAAYSPLFIPVTSRPRSGSSPLQSLATSHSDTTAPTAALTPPLPRLLPSSQSPQWQQQQQQQRGRAGSDALQLCPNWEHFSNNSLVSPPVAVAPQKRIPNAAVVGVASGGVMTGGSGVVGLGSGGGGAAGRRDDQKGSKQQQQQQQQRPLQKQQQDVEKAWTVVSKVAESAHPVVGVAKNSGGGDGGGSPSPAAKQLQRIASQHDESVATDPLKDFLLESVTLNSVATAEEEGVKGAWQGGQRGGGVGVVSGGVGNNKFGSSSSSKISPSREKKGQQRSSYPQRGGGSVGVVSGGVGNDKSSSSKISPSREKKGQQRSSYPQAASEIKDTLFDNLHYAFPHVDDLFSTTTTTTTTTTSKTTDTAAAAVAVSARNADAKAQSSSSAAAKVESAKVNGRVIGVDDRKFDYVEIEVGPPKGPARNLGGKNSDYAVIKLEPSGQKEGAGMGVWSGKKGDKEEEEEDENYSRLSDVMVDFKRDSHEPLKVDPLYTLPDQVLKKLEGNGHHGNSGVAAATTTPPTTATTPATRATPVAGVVAGFPATTATRSSSGKSSVANRKGVASSSKTTPTSLSARGRGAGESVPSPQLGFSTSDERSRKHTREAISRLHPQTRQKLQEAQDVFAKAEASTGSDDMVAMALYQQFSSMLFLALQDPVVSATPSLYQQIKTRREEGVRRCLLLQKNGTGSHTKDLPGHCKGCGKRRELDERQLCGPCQLREKLKQKVV